MIKDIVQTIATLGTGAIAKIDTDILALANKSMEKAMSGELFKMYTEQPSADTILSITKGTPTLITMAASHYRRTGSYVFISGINDNGLMILNGKKKIIYESATQFYVDGVNTDSDADDYTSGGKVVDADWEDLERAEAYFVLYHLIPAIQDIKLENEGAVIMVKSKEWGGGSYEPSTLQELKLLANWFKKRANEIVNRYAGNGDIPGGKVRMMII